MIDKTSFPWPFSEFLLDYLHLVVPRLLGAVYSAVNIQLQSPVARYFFASSRMVPLRIAATFPVTTYYARGSTRTAISWITLQSCGDVAQCALEGQRADDFDDLLKFIIVRACYHVGLVPGLGYKPHSHLSYDVEVALAEDAVDRGAWYESVSWIEEGVSGA